MLSSHTQDEERQEDEVEGNDGSPEVNLPERFVHHSSGRLREPEIHARKQAEQSSRRHHVVEVRDHVVTVMQHQVREVEPKW